MLAELGVLAHPVDIGFQRLGKPAQARVEQRRIIKEDEIEPQQLGRRRLVVDPTKNDRREALVE